MKPNASRHSLTAVATMSPDLPLHQLYAAEWRRVTASKPAPARLRRIRSLDFGAFRERVMSGNPAVIGRLVDAVYSGDILILRDAFPAEVLKRLRNSVHAYGSANPKVEGRIVDDCPNYRYRADSAGRENGGYGSLYNVYNFFRWNEDPLGLFEMAAEPYRLMKTVSGFPTDQFEDNRPADGTVDKIEILHYPHGGGGIDMHADPDNNVKLTMGINLSEAEIDYSSGGFVVIDADGSKRRIEHDVLLGSIVSFYPTLNHGVDAVDPAREFAWDDIAGRWFMGITSVHSHMVEDRDVTVPVDGYDTIHEQKRRVVEAAA